MIKILFISVAQAPLDWSYNLRLWGPVDSDWDRTLICPACSFILPSAPKSSAWLPLDSFTGPSFTGTAGKTAMKSPQLISRKWRNSVDAKFVS